jgi:hypothetical protein
MNEHSTCSCGGGWTFDFQARRVYCRTCEDRDWLDEIEAQMDDTSPYYLPRLIAEIRRLRVFEKAPAKGLSWRGVATESLTAVPPAPLLHKRYCGPCDKWVPARETECKACGAPTDKADA